MLENAHFGEVYFYFGEDVEHLNVARYIVEVPKRHILSRKHAILEKAKKEKRKKEKSNSVKAHICPDHPRCARPHQRCHEG